jgi:NADH:ubiquinone oxidoreductase subunit 5 (subunit L)/multisubunit Na+/H+ antiporter MnhA subunit
MFTPERIMIWAPWMVIFMPLFGFIILAFLGGLAKKQGNQKGMMFIATGCVFASFIFAMMSVRSLLALPAGDHGLHFAQPALPLNFIDVAGFAIPMSLLIDPLSATMMLVVAGIGSSGGGNVVGRWSCGRWMWSVGCCWLMVVRSRC